MALRYQHREVVSLTSGQASAAVSFVQSVWPGAASDVSQMTLIRDPQSPSGLSALLDGTLVAADVNALPGFPIQIVSTE